MACVNFVNFACISQEKQRADSLRLGLIALHPALPVLIACRTSTMICPADTCFPGCGTVAEMGSAIRHVPHNASAAITACNGIARLG